MKRLLISSFLLVVSDRSTHQKENETAIALLLSDVFFITLSASWLLVRRCMAISISLLLDYTCGAMFTARARNEHIMHAHA